MEWQFSNKMLVIVEDDDDDDYNNFKFDNKNFPFYPSLHLILLYKKFCTFC